MGTDELKQILESRLDDCEVQVTGDGNHFDLVVIGDVFEGMRAVKKQQLVYATINEEIASGSVHAVNMKIFTKVEWAAQA